MLPQYLKDDLKKYYRALEVEEKRHRRSPNDETTLRKLSLISTILTQLCERVADAHQDMLEAAVFPEDKAHHLAHVLGYCDMAIRHEDAALDYDKQMAEMAAPKSYGMDDF